MAKNAISRAWSLVLGEGNRRYSDSPFDTIPPSSPVIIATGVFTQNSIELQVISPSVDARHPVVSYTFEFATDVNGPWTARTPIGAVQATSKFNFTNLSPSTTYFFRARGQDGSIAGNLSAYSATISAQTDTSSAITDWWPNWPTMRVSCLQGVIADNIAEPAYDQCHADQDVIVFQGFYPSTTRLTNRVSYIARVRAAQSAPMNTKFLNYQNTNQTFKTMGTPGNSPLEVNKVFIEDANLGNPNWYLHRDEPNQAQILEPNFDPANNRQCNMARGSGTNSFGRTYVQEFWRQWELLLDTGVPATDLKDVMNGFFNDNFDARPPDIWVNNGATLVTDYDMDDDGTPDVRNLYTSASNAGGRMWAEGALDSKLAQETEFPGYLVMPNSAHWAGDYFDGKGQPPLPLASHPFYQKFDVILCESVHLNLSLNKVGSGASGSYTWSGGSLQSSMRTWAIQQRFLRPDAQNDITGRGCMVAHTNCVDRGAGQPLQASDLEYARFFSALALLNERVCLGVVMGGDTCVPLDEAVLELGAPTAPRSMGTLNETNVSFSLRTPNQTVGVARFYWAEFAKGIVVVRGDSPAASGAWPTADAAVTCTLPSPGVGKVWRSMNASTYVNPITGRAARNQSPSINNGNIVTGVALKPFHARFYVRANS